jgi:hypothetical protein
MMTSLNAEHYPEVALSSSYLIVFCQNRAKIAGYWRQNRQECEESHISEVNKSRACAIGSGSDDVTRPEQTMLLLVRLKLALRERGGSGVYATRSLLLLPRLHKSTF